MALDAVKNFGKASVSAGYAAGVTTIVLATGEGAKFPNPSVDGAFNFVWWNYTDYADPSDDPSVEVCRCTARTGDSFDTIVRAQEGTADVNHNTGGKTYKVILAMTAKMITDINTFVTDAELVAIAGLTFADASIIQLTGAGAAAVLTSGGNNYFLGSSSDNSALEFKTPANVLSQIGAAASGHDHSGVYQPLDANLTSLAGLSHAVGDLIYASGAAAYTALADVAVGSYLASGGINTAPAWATLNQAAVAGLTTDSSPVFVTVKLSGLTDGYVSYHVSDATGLGNSPIYTDGTNVGIGTTNGFGTSAAKVLSLGLGTSPTTSPTDVAQLWTIDQNLVGGRARLHTRTEDGVSSPLALQSEVDSIVNPKLPSQAVNMTAAAAGSSGITVADNDNIDFGTGNFTLVWRGSLLDWTPGAEQDLLQRSPNANIQFYISSTNKIAVFLSGAGGAIKNFQSTSVPNFIDGSVHEIAAVIIRETAAVAGSIDVYVDGVLYESASISTGSGGSLSNADNLYVLGGNAVRYAGTTSFAATYNRALTAAEVLDLYRNGINYADKWGNQTSIITGNDSTFAGASNWVNISVNSYDETGDLSITASADGQICELPAVYAPMVIGYKYRLEFDSANVVASWFILGPAQTNSRGTVNSNGHQVFEFVAADTGGILFYSTASNSSGDFDNFTLTILGVTLALEPEGIQVDKWYDSSSNYLNASYPAAGSSLLRSPYQSFVIGGQETTSDLSFKTTTGVGTTGADMHFLVGNNGATEAMTILNSGNVGIQFTAPLSSLCTPSLHVGGESAAGDNNLLVDGTGTFSDVIVNSQSLAQNYFYFTAADTLITGDQAPWIPIAFAGSVVGVYALVKTASTSGAITVDVLKCADPTAAPPVWTSILSTKITIDQDERTTETALTAAVIKSDGTEDFALNDAFRINIDGAGTGAADLTVRMVTQK